ncbi:MAG: RNA polymerase sigma factor [Gallionellales bacterium RIFCSPLOWO2_02_FULL_57_47]|nr:MAG: RNA polymerase sigma factor [Gallionellales bacterium RIFCSPLOWO2_02_FULL_57_47]OGT13777.1 MAG: RNA polymerase sigma factor [Gallionellales bacterium RIFCSPHIGHO2_02_FULL_57_16]
MRHERLFATIPPRKGASKLSSPAELAQFLSSVERRAYKHALYAVRDEHTALDIVQDAMIKLAEKYGGKPAAELPLLFQRILQNTIRDHYRRQKVRNAWTTLFSSLAPKNESDDFDPLDSLRDEENQSAPATPDDALRQNQVIALIEQALVKLPARQREAFLLRYWEGMDTTETAITMGCSEGSVKTHCSRAAHALAVALKEKGVELP